MLHLRVHRGQSAGRATVDRINERIRLVDKRFIVAYVPLRGLVRHAVLLSTLTAAI